MITIKRLGHVVLKVRDLEKSVRFYRDILGLKEVARYRNAMVFFSIDDTNHHDIAIMSVGKNAPSPEPNSVGLYHIALKIGDTIEELKAAKQWLEKNGASLIGAADHKVSKSLYLTDPDGNEIELYVDAKDWKKHQKEIAVEPLDI